MAKLRFRCPDVPFVPAFLRRVDVTLALMVALVVSALVAHHGGDVLWSDAPAPEVAARQSLPEGEEVVEESMAPIPKAGKPVRFLMQNVQNYFVAGEESRSRYTIRPKSVRSREAVAEVIASARPEVVGLVEMGGALALKDLAERLAARGLKYPYSRVLTRQGEDRALAVLSMHPLVEDHSQANYGLFGQQNRKMLRGILDVTVQVKDGRRFRIIGAHLKSRVGDNPAAAASLRAREARTLAMYIQRVVRRQPKMPLLVYGDWNDGPSDASLGVLTQGLSRDAALTRLDPEDSRGDKWTLYYKAGREYCTFDQIFVNSALRQRRGRKSESGIVDIPASRSASDHRAVWCELR